MGHPGQRGTRITPNGSYFADSQNRVVRLALFFDDSFGATA
jgi:hypothetical protein